MKAITTEAQYKQYFNGSFQGMNSIIHDVLSPIFGEFTPTTSPTGVDYVDVYGDGGANIDHIYDYGKYVTDTTDVSVFEVVLSERCHISRARKGIKETVIRITGKYSGAFIVFHYPDGSTNAETQIWRLSWLKRLDVHREDSPAKRYTYLCGPSYSCRTIAKRFYILYKEENKTLDSITKAFDAEALSDEFFKEYKVLYDDIVQWITGQRVVKQDNKWKEIGKFGSGNGKTICDSFLKEFNKIEEEEEKTKLSAKAIRDYVKKMLGRLVFIQFLQKKGYLGIDGKPTQNFLLDLFNCITDEQRDDFIDTALEQVVYLLLNSDDRKPGSEIINNHTLDVPFLNGGLFERDRWDDIDVKIPMEFFHNEGYQDVKREFGTTELRPDDKFLTQCGILDLFNHYNFTIDENDPDDAEVGVDPEMLGKIFENLLEDNKEKGAFYTPKEIVQYMCKEALIAYLCTKVTGHDDDIRAFVEKSENNNVPEKKKILEALKEVKICDPAIGSGAFPMGLLNLLVALREKLEPSANRCELKKDIIQNNIYGVDIEKGAIDIARLRFWLSIMVDEDVDESKPRPTPLPNFDYKFMQGNSLIESFAGHDLSHILDNEKTASTTIKSKKFNPNQTGMDFSSDDTRQNLQIWLSKYFSLSNHDEKDEYRKLINKSVKSYIEQQGISTSEESLLKDIDPSENQSFFLWHTWFRDVFERDAKGFDIVIGNPPYFNIETLGAKSQYAESVKSAYSNIWQDKSDILFYFFGLALNLSKNIICYITSNAYLFSDKAKKLRNKFIDDKRLNRIVNFEEYKIFGSASITTCITLLSNNHDLFSAVNVKGTEFSLATLMDYIQNASNAHFVTLKKDSVFALVTSQIDEINNKIDGTHKKLNSLFKIGSGMQTAANGIFCFSDYPAHFPLEYIKHRMSGEIIKKYIHEESNEFLLYIEDVECFEDLPSPIQDYLIVNKMTLCNRAQIKRSPTSVWWKYVFPMHKEYYCLDKIWCSYRCKTNTFALDESSDYVGLTNTTVIFDTNELLSLKYLLALLNSRVLTFRYKSIGKQTGGGVYEFFENGVGKLPIPEIGKEKQQVFIDLIDRILLAKRDRADADTSDFEDKIDELVYHLYGLTYDEVLVVDPNTKINKEEYESTKTN